MSTETTKNILYKLYTDGRISRYDYLRRLMPDSSIFDMMEQYYHECCTTSQPNESWWKNSDIDKDIAISAIWNKDQNKAVPPTIENADNCFQVLNNQFAFYMNKQITKDTMIAMPFASGTYKIVRNDMSVNNDTVELSELTVDMLQICNDIGEPISIKDYIVPLRQNTDYSNVMFIVAHDNFEPVLKIKMPKDTTVVNFSILGIGL